MIKRPRLWLGVLGLIILTLVSWGFYKNQQLDARLTIEVAPADSTISINDQVVESGEHRLRHGTVNVVIGREGFDEQNQSIVIDSGQSEYLGVILSPQPAFEDWYATHPSDQKLAEGISSKTFDAQSQKTTAQNPLVKQLPYVDPTGIFRVDYGPSQKYPNDPAKIMIYITAKSGERRQAARDWLKSQGADLRELEISYR